MLKGYVEKSFRTDSRAKDYIKKHGKLSWELDALEPRVLAEIVENSIMAAVDQPAWDEAWEQERQMKDVLQKASQQFNKLIE